MPCTKQCGKSYTQLAFILNSLALLPDARLVAYQTVSCWCLVLINRRKHAHLGLDLHKISHHRLFSGDIAEGKEMFSARQQEAETTILTALRGET